MGRFCNSQQSYLEEVDAFCIIVAGRGITHSDILFASQTTPSKWTEASVSVDLICASATVKAWRGGTIIVVCFTKFAQESFVALTLEGIVHVDAAFGTERGARIRDTLVDFCFALHTYIAWLAFTLETN